MYPQRETNPHFLPLQPQWQQPPAPESHQDDFSLEMPTQTRSHKPSKRARPQHGTSLHSPTPSHPSLHHQPYQERDTNQHFFLPPTSTTPQQSLPHQQPLHSGHAFLPPTTTPQWSRPHQQPGISDHAVHPPIPTPKRSSSHQQPLHSDEAVHPSQQSSVQRIPPSRKTKPFTWCIAIVCALFWITIILGGLIVLIVYLVFHPKSPKFDVAEASLNAVYLDMGYLLNADVTLMANFTNPNKKVNLKFNYAIITLYHDTIPIATNYIEHFSIMRSQYLLVNVHMVTSQVRLSPQHIFTLKKELQSGRVKFEIKAIFNTKTRLGSILRYSTRLYGHCNIITTDPPSGILVAKTCVTKR